MRSLWLRTGNIHDILRQYDKYLGDYDAYIAEHPELSMLSDSLTGVGAIIAEHPELSILSDSLTGVGAIMVSIFSDFANDPLPTAIPAGIEIYSKFNEWVQGKMQTAPKGVAEEISALGMGIWEDDLNLRWREFAERALTCIQKLYREHGDVVTEAIGHYDKALQAIVADYQKKVHELEESKQVKPESDEKIAAELGGYRKGGAKKSEKDEDGVKVERNDEGKTWQERVGGKKESGVEKSKQGEMKQFGTSKGGREGSPNGKDSGESRGK